MTCDYFTYKKITDRLFYGVALTDAHMNAAIKEIHEYFLAGGAAEALAPLKIGLRILEKQHALFPELNEVISRRFIFLEGERKGRELSIHEICAIGLFLKHGPYYGRLNSNGTLKPKEVTE